MENKNTVFSKVKRTVAFAGLGLLLAQGLLMATASTSQAQDDLNGSCFPKTNFICGLNGHNYDNHDYQSGSGLQ